MVAKQPDDKATLTVVMPLAVGVPGLRLPEAAGEEVFGSGQSAMQRCGLAAPHAKTSSPIALSTALSHPRIGHQLDHRSGIRAADTQR
jgi:hypothetical protein